MHSPHPIFEAPCLSPALLNVWDPEMLGCGGAGRIKQGPGTGPAFSHGLQGPDPVSSCHPEAPRPSGRAGAVCARGRAGAVRALAGAMGSGLAPRCRGRDCAESPLFSSVGKVGPTPRPDRMWPGWLPAPSRRWPLFSDASRGPDPSSHRNSEALAGSPGLMRGGRGPQSPRPAPLITGGWGESRERARRRRRPPPLLWPGGRTGRVPGGAGPLLCE